MYIVNNRVPVASGWEEIFEERFRQRVGQIDKQDGFISMQILKPEKQDTPYIVMTSWKDKDAFEHWVSSDDFRAAHSNPMPSEAFNGKGQIEMFDVVISTDQE
jgi:heme-degrading monooxygenase HmoA